MRHLVRRFRYRVRARWLTAAGFALAGAGAFLLVPRLTSSPSLELVALDQGGRFRASVAIPRSAADTTASGANVVARVPLVLAVRNTGGEAVRPGRLDLGVPPHFRLAAADGTLLHARFADGSPLIQYRLDAPFPTIEPGRLPVLLPGRDTLWLEVRIPAFYCVALSDSIPEFLPAPPPAVQAISRLRIFYSFEGGGLEDRQTGLLGVQLDSAMLHQETPEPPPLFPAEVRTHALRLPPMTALQHAGVRRSRCGEPEDPVELLTTLWETPGGGRFFVLDYGGAPRKYLFDLNRDSIIELEMWDPDSDGDFEARRRARLPIPPFLMPPPPPPPFDPSIFADVPEDSLPALLRFWNAMADPIEGDGAPADSTRRLERLRPTIIVKGDDDADPRDARRGTTLPGYARPSAPVLGAPVQRPAAVGERVAPQDSPAPGDPATAGEAAPDQPVLEPVAPQAAPRRPEPELLGRPIDVPPPPPDTSGTGN